MPGRTITGIALAIGDEIAAYSVYIGIRYARSR